MTFNEADFSGMGFSSKPAKTNSWYAENAEHTDDTAAFVSRWILRCFHALRAIRVPSVLTSDREKPDYSRPQGRQMWL